MTSVNREVAPFTGQWLPNQLSTIEMSQADSVGAIVKAKVEVLNRLLQWCCGSSKVSASCACGWNFTIVGVGK